MEEPKEEKPILISIHASKKEATNAQYKQEWIHNISIHASKKEATCSRSMRVHNFDDFNPRLQEGGDYLESYK